MVRIITADMLREKQACADQLRVFEERFPNGAEVSEALARELALVFDWEWAAKALLSPSASKAYNEATALAWEAYNEATAPASKAYNEATALAWEAYNEAKATAPASKAYNEALALASKSYNEDEATAPASKAYAEATALAFARAYLADEGVCP
jgi:hypothetical protein